ncbi:MAG: SPOR domain-containing protein [Gemmatimonadota bacterium]
MPNGLPAEASLLRLPRDGGVASLLRADLLSDIAWHTSGLPAITRALGTDREEQMVYVVDDKGRLIGIDLRAQRWRPYLQSARDLTSTADGVIIGLDSARHPLRLATRALTTFRASVDRGTTELLGAQGGQLVAFSAAGKVAQVLDEDGEARRITLPRGSISGTWAGDLLAVTTDSGLVLADPSGKRAEPEYLSIRGNPVATVFSPSGHRIYVARQKGDLVMFDRFTRENLRALTLPGVARALRVDRTGRWLLARPSTGDSVWVVDLVRWDVVTTILTPWADDLPEVAGGRTLIARDGRDVIAIDLTAQRPSERSRLAGAADDVFLLVPWSPVAQPVEVAVTPPPVEADSVDALGDSVPDEVPPTTPVPPAVTIPTAPTGGAASSVFLQVASSQNIDWANAFATQLKDGGFPARVLNPKAAGDPYRVVIGPYLTRDEADAVGRRLGRPYFLLTPGSGET